MYQITGSKSYQIEFSENGITVDGKPFNGKIIKQTNDNYLLVLENEVIPIEILQQEGKTIRIKYKGMETSFSIEDELDLTIAKLGFKNTAALTHDKLKAPMPGMILEIRVNEGDTVQKGDVLLILEAMKMENVIKASHDGNIEKIHVTKGQTVEKNQLLIQF